MVAGITSSLDASSRTAGATNRLAGSKFLAYIGFLVNGIGFVIDRDEALQLIARSAANVEVVKPYLNGHDLNSRPDSSASRYVVDFQDWGLGRAQSYPDCLAILRERAKPARDALPDYKRRVRDTWWQFEYVGRFTENLAGGDHHWHDNL